MSLTKKNLNAFFGKQQLRLLVNINKMNKETQKCTMYMYINILTS